jgi:hypothetical protein
MDWGMIAAMIAVSTAVSSLMGFVVSLMIRASISEASNLITRELHSLLSERYVLKEMHVKEIQELKDGIEWLEGLIERTG